MRDLGTRQPLGTSPTFSDKRRKTSHQQQSPFYLNWYSCGAELLCSLPSRIFIALGGRLGPDLFDRVHQVAYNFCRMYGERWSISRWFRAPVVQWQGERRRQRKEDGDGASGPRERYRRCEVAPCAQPVRHYLSFDDQCPA